jgi:hypothetical protein
MTKLLHAFSVVLALTSISLVAGCAVITDSADGSQTSEPGLRSEARAAPTAATHAPVACANINDETDCLAVTSCAAVYTGSDCTGSDGLACSANDTSCTCASLEFASCEPRTLESHGTCTVGTGDPNAGICTQ